MKILFSNLGYAKGIGGSLSEHLRYVPRHFYHSPNLQKKVLLQFRQIITEEQPDLCCMVEIDAGSIHSGYFNQLEALMCKNYCISDIAVKYGDKNWLSRLPLHSGKSNAFLGRRPFTFERHYFPFGKKRLIHQLDLGNGVILFFTHFSLRKAVRVKQFYYIQQLIASVNGPVLLLADFNILYGMSELAPLLKGIDLVLPDTQQQPTFRFHRWHPMLDICLCSQSLARNVRVSIIPQSFSDHAALLVTLKE